MQLQLAAISPVFFAVLATATVIPPSWSMPAARLTRRQGKDLADFNKPPKIINTNPLEVDMNWEFAGMLKPVGVSNVREWPREEWNYPSQCVEEVKFEWNTGTCNLANMKVMDVTYEDCYEPWTLCYCEGSELSRDDFINFVGQFPVRTRDVLRHGVSLPPNGKTGAYLRYPDLTLTGSGMQDRNGEKRLHFFLIFHELGHLLDRGASSSEDYFKAIESDSCILRDTPNLVENFGNLGPMIAAKHVNEGRYNQIYKDLGLECLSNQLAFAEAQMGELLTWGGTCTGRLSPDFDVVNIPNGVLTKRDLETPSSGLVERASICHNYASVF